MVAWGDLLVHPREGDHLVELYGNDDRLLATHVGRYLAAGLRRLDGLVVIATPAHAKAITRYLADTEPVGAPEAERVGRLRYLDAATTLSRLLKDGRPDATLFHSVVSEPLREARRRSGSGQVRAFGEMVGLLWTEGRHADAATLEGFWNAALLESGCSLYCAYPIDFAGACPSSADLTPIVASHTHLCAGPATVISSGRAGH